MRKRYSYAYSRRTWGTTGPLDVRVISKGRRTLPGRVVKLHLQYIAGSGPQAKTRVFVDLTKNMTMLVGVCDQEMSGS